MRLTRFALLVTALMGVALFAFAGACGSNSSQFGNGTGGGAGSSNGGAGGIHLGGGGSGGSGASGGSAAGGTSTTMDGGPPCSGCKVDPCIAQGMPQTTITGTVFNPGGTLSLYDVYVYVPNSQPAPIDPGNPACTPCEAPASGDPILGTLTDEQGNFSLSQATGGTGYGVPSGKDIPLVIQTGKWRKQITLPMVTACGMTAAAPGDATATG